MHHDRTKEIVRLGQEPSMRVCISQPSSARKGKGDESRNHRNLSQALKQKLVWAEFGGSDSKAWCDPPSNLSTLDHRPSRPVLIPAHDAANPHATLMFHCCLPGGSLDYPQRMNLHAPSTRPRPAFLVPSSPLCFHLRRARCALRLFLVDFPSPLVQRLAEKFGHNGMGIYNEKRYT